MRPGTFLDPFGRLRRSHLPGTTWLVPFLAATLGLCLWLGWQAIAVARTHREAAESTLRDYAHVAAFEYSRIVDDELDDMLDELFDDVDGYRRRPPSLQNVLSDLDDALPDIDRCDCAELRSPDILFRYDVAERRVETMMDTVPPAVLASLAAAIDARVVTVSGRDRDPGLFSMPAGSLLETETAVAYRRFYSDRDGIDGLHSVYGIVVPTRAFAPLLARRARRGTLLPPVIAGETPNDSLLHLAVRDVNGATYYKSALDFEEALAAYDTLSSEYGPLVIEASVRPDAAARLVIGGLPNSKLPLILGLLMLTLGVGAAALFQLRRERQLARLRDDFISGVSHELRTPLAQIRVFAELQEAGKLRSDIDRARATSVINREAQRLTHLVENILRFARLRRTGGAGFVTESISVSDALADLLEAFRPLASARRMSIDLEIEPRLAVVANRDALNQVLVNLLDNAVKYGPTGQTIRVRAARHDGAAFITVEDQGPGVPAADRRRIWEPYVRLERALDSKLPGTGIGLAIVAQLTALHGGRVHVEDGEHGGARFVLELPVAVEKTSTEPPASKPDIAPAERVPA